jgi:hypothetical protein
LKVLYIAGSGRSGSTILDNILGQYEGFVSVGEVRFIWERGMQEDRRCGCGQAFSTCPFWSEVLDRAFAGSPPPPERMIELLRRGTRARQIPAMLGGARRRARFLRRLDELPAVLEALYDAIAATGGARIVVDSSKLPTYGRVLGSVPAVELIPLHLVRDPRATAYSWLRKRPLPDKDGAFMQQQGVLRSSALWTIWNSTPAMFWPNNEPVRYETLIRSPRATIEAIVERAGGDPADGPFVSDNEVDLRPTHGVAGNPSRFVTGKVTLRPDEEWRERMRSVDRQIVTALTLPLLAKFGYVGRA